MAGKAQRLTGLALLIEWVDQRSPRAVLQYHLDGFRESLTVVGSEFQPVLHHFNGVGAASVHAAVALLVE